MKMIEVMRNERRDTIYGTHLILSRDNRQIYVPKTFLEKLLSHFFPKRLSLICSDLSLETPNAQPRR